MSVLVDHEIMRRCIHEPRMIYPFIGHKVQDSPSHGLGSIGYDVRLGKEFVWYTNGPDVTNLHPGAPTGLEEEAHRATCTKDITLSPGLFVLAHTVERFVIPKDVYATVHDKSSWMRLGLSVHNTVIEPGWEGILTLELHNENPVRNITINCGDGIAQIIFHKLDNTPLLSYRGQYQGQTSVTLPGWKKPD